MNVLFDNQIFFAQKFGGISRYFNELSKTPGVNINRMPIEETNDNAISNDFLSRGIRFSKRKLGFKQVENQLNPPNFEKIFDEFNFDIFHPTYYDPYFLKYTQKPFVLTVYDMIHEIYKEYFPLSDNTSANKLLLCNKANHIIAISEKTKSDLVDIFKISPSKISVTLLASDFDKVEVGNKVLFDNSKKNILFVGSRHAYKNFYYPLVAIADIMKEDEDVRLICTGHPFSNDEIAYFDYLGITDRIKHVFLQDDGELAWSYSNAHLFIFPSLYEGFGFPLLEAFASGCPTISSNGGSLPEVGGNAALYFEPKSIVSIREKLRSAIYDIEVRKQLVANGYIRLQHFSWDKCRQQTLDVYNSII